MKGLKICVCKGGVGVGRYFFNCTYHFGQVWSIHKDEMSVYRTLRIYTGNLPVNNAYCILADFHSERNKNCD